MVERDADRPLQGDIRLHHAYRGGERRGQGRGRASPGKTPFVAAVQCSPEGHPIAMRMDRLAGFRTTHLAAWANRALLPGSRGASDRLRSVAAITQARCLRTAIVTGSGGADRAGLGLGQYLSWATSKAPCMAPIMHGGPRTCSAACPNCAAASTGPWTWPPWCGDGSSRRGLRHRCRIQG
ncbi:transposase, partial [Xanthomonas theicola]|uniref:transposase n=1 Tax=Xanthomonas theicola TaxID=56464 RepID=UPI0011B0E8F6